MPVDFGETGLRKSAAFYWHRIPLDRDLSAVFTSFHKNCVQRKIRRAEREGLTYKEGRDRELIRHFYHLLLLSHRRHGLPPQPIVWFHNLAECLGDAMKIRVAYKNGIPIAGIVTLQYKRSMVYKYGGSDSRHHNLGGVAFLFWRIIQEAHAEGLEAVDMGRSDCDNGGLIAFKERWGAARCTLNYWVYPPGTVTSPQAWKLKAAKRIFSLVPTAILPTAGRLLYRHMA
ncbi:MAG: GNAT family N-acetyltransferase [Acidobacteriia bacterium]|nr:GNAT family N-acetyltransferase [Terriglobia bacterium]